MTRETGKDPTDRPRSIILIAGLGISTAVISMTVPLSYDEGNWLVDVGRWSRGESLYSDIPENKAPLLFLLIRTIDSLPGPFTSGRALFLAGMVMVLAAGARSLALTLGLDERRAQILAGIVGASAALQAVFTMNFEVPAATLTMSGLAVIASGRPGLGGLITAGSTGFDIRAIALLPGVGLFALAKWERRAAMRALFTMGVLTGSWVVAVLVIDDLRYSMIELNVATRAATTSWSPLDQGYAMLRGLAFPFASALAFARGSSSDVGRPIGRSAIALLVAGIGVSIASLQPFDKYWSLVLPGIALIAVSNRRPMTVPIVVRLKAVGGLGLALAVAFAITSSSDQARLVDRYERAARVIHTSLSSGATFTRFDTQPFLGVFLPERDDTPVAVLDFVVADTSRRNDILGRFEASIARASAIVDDGALSADEEAVAPAYRDLWRIFRRLIGDFPCVRAVDLVTVRYRTAACPEPIPTLGSDLEALAAHTALSGSVNVPFRKHHQS